MNKIFLKLVVISLFCLASACSTELTKPYLMEIVGLDPQHAHEYELRVVEVNKTPEIYANNNNNNFIYLSSLLIYQEDLAEAALVSDSFDQLRMILQSKIGGIKLDPVYTKNNNIYSAGTFESLIAMSAFYHFDALYKFAEKNNLLQKDYNRRPLRIGIYGEIYTTSQDLVPIVKHDNAVYIGSVDAIILLPLGSNAGLPMALNEGILAHEYHHRLFFNQIWLSSSSPKRFHRFQARYDGSKKRALMRSHLLLAATDEALADLFAVAFTGLPDFMKASLSDKKTRHINNQRAINHQFAEKITYDMLAHGHLSKKFKLYCPEPSRNFTNANFNIYCLATLIAKTIYEACDKNTVLLGNYALPLIHRILPEIGENLEKNKSYNLEMLFELLASRSKKEHPVFHAQLCHELRARFSSLITKNRIKSCAKL